jgi:hypothetical protein
LRGLRACAIDDVRAPIRHSRAESTSIEARENVIVAGARSPIS